MTARARTHRFALVFAGVLAAAVCGCGAKTGTVAGKVTVDGKPAVGATVILTGENNQSAAAIVREDGTYETPGVPVGPVTIALMPDAGIRIKAPTDLGAQPVPSPALPERYTNAATSGLTLTVTGGRNEFNIEMISP